VINRELAPYNNATVPPIIDRAADPYDEVSAGIRWCASFKAG
jgi:hypothetical protein